MKRACLCKNTSTHELNHCMQSRNFLKPHNNQKRNKSRFLLLFLLLIALSACSPSVLDTLIDPTTLQETAARIRKEMPELESAKKDLLTQLELIQQGREAFQTGNSQTAIEPAKFDMYKEQLFNFFQSHQTTYRQLFDEVEAQKEFNQQFGEKITAMHRQIDDFCSARQNEINEKENQVQRTIAELSKTINVNIISIRTNRYFQHESVEVLAQITNTGSEPIESIDFNLHIQKGGNVIARLPIRMDDRFVSNKIKKFNYTRESNPGIFAALKNIDIYSITLKEEVFKINMNGKTVDAYAPMRGVTNHHYQSNQQLAGECPYLTEQDPIFIEMQELNKKKQEELALKMPCLAKIENIRELLFAPQS